MKRKSIHCYVILFFIISSATSLTALVSIDYLYEITENTVIYDNVEIELGGIIQNASGGSYTLTIYGNIENYGTIRNNPSSHWLTVRVSGNVRNDAQWSCYSTRLIGSATQTIHCDAIASFSGSYFYNDNPANIFALSSLNFVNCHIDFLNNGSLDLSGGWILDVYDGSVYRMTIIGDPVSGSGLYLHDGAYIHTVSASNMVLSGIINIHDSSVIFTGSLINNAVVQNTSNTRTLSIQCDVINNGTFQNYSMWELSIYAYGDIENNGTWSNATTTLNGTSEQHISCGAGNNFSCSIFRNYNPNNIIADSDISFDGTEIDFLDNGSLDLSAGWDLTMNGQFLKNADIIGGSSSRDSTELNIDNSYFYDVTASDIILNGTVNMQSDNIFTGSLINNAVVRNSSNNCTIGIYCDVINNGSFLDYSMWDLCISASGDIENNGTWSNSMTYINGSVDQNITIVDGHEITGVVRFQSDIAVAPYQWRFDGTDLNSPDFTGETAYHLYWNVPLASGWFGTFDCVTGGGTSRDIIVVESGTAPNAPQNLTISIVGSNIELDWDDVIGATSYTVYSDSDPYGSFGTVEWTGAASECTLPITEDKKFYRVTASN